MPTVISLFDGRTEAMRAYDALLNRGFRSMDSDILTNDDKDDVPKLAKLRESIPEPDVDVYLEGIRQGGALITVNANPNTTNKAAEVMSEYEIVNIAARTE
jgi:hypothetical protein